MDTHRSTLSCEPPPPPPPPPLPALSLSQMQRTQSRRAKHLRRKKGLTSSIKGVSHLSRRDKRRLYCRLQLCMWRKRREKGRFGIFRAKKRACGISSGPCLGSGTQKHKSKVPEYPKPNLKNCQVRASAVGCAGGGSEDAARRQSCTLKLCGPVGPSESTLQNPITDSNVSAGNVPSRPVAQTAPPQRTKALLQLSEATDSLKLSHTAASPSNCGSDECSLTRRGKGGRTMMVSERLEAGGPSAPVLPAPPAQEQAAASDTVSLKVLTADIHEFLDDFYRIYGSFIPLQKSDVVGHLRRRLNADFSDRRNTILSEVAKYRAAIIQKPVPSFRLVYRKHTLTLDDLSTLADQQWLNDQVMNMYGELIMESAHHKVHFLNSFFHRQLMTKGYDGVKRWTKQVDLFSKSLLLVPIHLEVHWCLVTADVPKKKICLYDSQGNALQKVARNVLKYLMAEAKEKQRTDFENGWMISYDEKIPQQSNENDCGVFVLEYSRCLALGKPLQFSQKDIPKIRKRIYKELCHCKLHELD